MRLVVWWGVSRARSVPVVGDPGAVGVPGFAENGGVPTRCIATHCLGHDTTVG